VPDPYLVAAALSNPAGFAAIDDRLHDLCVAMLRDRDAAADCVQDTCTTAATRLAQLRERDELRPWLYAIARHEALARLRARRPEQPIDEFAEAQQRPGTRRARRPLRTRPTGGAGAGGLAERDRSCSSWR
jgi:DNA-directed RNA polymerase specialized sigma24 family protein